MNWINFNKNKLSCLYYSFGYFIILWLTAYFVIKYAFYITNRFRFSDVLSVQITH